MSRILFLAFTFFMLNKSIMSQDYDMLPVTGAKMYFSDKPFTSSHEGSKVSFTSGDFIYGRIEFDKQTLLDAFKLPKDGETTMNNRNDTYLEYCFGLYKDGKMIAYWSNYRSYLYISGNEKGKSWINFDIAPSPEKCSSYFSLTEDFNHSRFFPFYSRLISPDNFRNNGEYTIMLLLYNQSRDAWGRTEDPSKWPVVAGEFSYSFDAKDIASLKQSGEAAQEKINTVKADKLPDCFTNPVKISDPAVTIAKVTPVIKSYLKDYEVLKVAIEPAASMWSIVKTDLGLLSYRYVTGYYRIVYKEKGQCKLGSVRIFQDYISNGKYGNLYCKFWGGEGDIDCGKVK